MTLLTDCLDLVALDERDFGPDDSFTEYARQYNLRAVGMMRLARSYIKAIEHLKNLQSAQTYYQGTLTEFEPDHKYTVRASTALQNEGDAARAFLSSIGAHNG